MYMYIYVDIHTYEYTCIYIRNLCNLAAAVFSNNDELCFVSKAWVFAFLLVHIYMYTNIYIYICMHICSSTTCYVILACLYQKKDDMRKCPYLYTRICTYVEMIGSE